MLDVQSISMAELHRHVGQEIGVSEWVTVTQEMVTKFAEATRDLEWMHIDVERSKRESPYKGTIVQGFLAMSLVIEWTYELNFKTRDFDYGLNYGCDRLRFTALMMTGCRLRGRFTLSSVTPRSQGQLVKLHCVVEMEGSAKPAVVMDWLVLWIPKTVQDKSVSTSM
jgi:acyl dehydratase